MLLFLINVIRSSRSGAAAPNDPWSSPTLEWATASPPPAYNFARIPIVASREPLWELSGIVGRVDGLSMDPPENLVTRVLDATPDHRSIFPRPGIWPFLSAVATTILFVGSIFTPWAIVWGSIPVAIALTAWFWPKKDEIEEHLALERKP
jgi:cytochrome c oxidase subunit I+III